MSNLGNKEVFAKNLNYYMDKNQKKRMDLCRDLDIRYTTLTEWATAKSYPRIDKIEKLANYFGIAKSDLVEEKAYGKRAGIQIPVLGSVPAGIPIEAVQDIIDYEEITAEMAANGEFFCLKINGMSMAPLIVDGDTVVVRCQESAETGDIVIAMVNGNEATVKRLKRDDNGIMLIPNNSEFLPISYSNEQIGNLPVTIIGKVIEMRRKL